MDMVGSEKHKHGQTISDLSFMNELSSFIHTKDSSILRFALFCSEAGIIENPSMVEIIIVKRALG